jgi:hypothetical protein
VSQAVPRSKFPALAETPGGQVTKVIGIRDVDETARGQSWNSRIRSARIGPLALPTVYSEELYAGRMWRMVSAEYGVLPDGFAGEIKSMQIQCAKPAAK